jgi:endonuclease YncB( thermonuclease family)
MNFKTFINGAALLIGLGLIGYSQFDKRSLNTQNIQTSQLPETKPQTYEEWSLKPGSIYDGDTLRVVKGNEELKIRFCGIDAPEAKQELGIEARDNLRSLIKLGNGELLIVPVEKDRYGRTVAEVYVKDSPNSAVNLNMQMLRNGYAWLYAQYVDNCPSKEQLEIAERLAQEESLGVWSNSSSIPPWEWRKANK